MMNNNLFDPITLEVMRNAFYSVADEMIAALVRASYSTTLKPARCVVRGLYPCRRAGCAERDWHAAAPRHNEQRSAHGDGGVSV